MLAVATGTATSATSSIALPSDYLGAFRLQFTTPTLINGTRLAIEDIEQLRTYDSTGGLGTSPPTVFTAIGTTYNFPLNFDQNYAYRLTYYAEPGLLGTASGALTNFLTVKAPRLVRAVCMGMAAEWRKKPDDRVYWLAEAAQEIDTLHREDDAEKRDINLALRVD